MQVSGINSKSDVKSSEKGLTIKAKKDEKDVSSSVSLLNISEDTFSPSPTKEARQPLTTDDTVDVIVPEGANPSQAFIERLKDMSAEAFMSLPDNLRQALKAHDYKVLAFRKVKEYLNKSLEQWPFQNTKTIIESLSSQGLRKLTDTQKEDIKEQLPVRLQVAKENGSLDDKRYQELMDLQSKDSDACLKSFCTSQYEMALRQTASIATAYTLKGCSEVIAHEKLPKFIESPLNLTSSLLRHETGHVIDSLLGERFSERPDVLKVMQEDLDDASRKGVLPIQKDAETNTFSLTPEGKQQLIPLFQESIRKESVKIGHVIEFDEEDFQEMTEDDGLIQAQGALHFTYYVPIYKNAELNKKALLEGFAEVFGGAFGGGAYPKGSTFFAEKVYPKTAEYIRTKLLPEIYENQEARKTNN